ncbi:putative deoxyribonuclease TATDN2 [Lytechinus pictus]|uniref:putative deoxyribonuclease TATDN2 n=1 Tax=Lytechinus pictus TaxID=7653 RepID=UPI0030BA1625
MDELELHAESTFEVEMDTRPPSTPPEAIPPEAAWQAEIDARMGPIPPPGSRQKRTWLRKLRRLRSRLRAGSRDSPNSLKETPGPAPVMMKGVKPSKGMGRGRGFARVRKGPITPGTPGTFHSKGRGRGLLNYLNREDFSLMDAPAPAPSSHPPPLLGFDSHFHPDRCGWYSKRKGKSVVTKHPVEIVGGVLNFCDPEFFMDPGFLSRVLAHSPPYNKRDGSWRLAVGIHPKQASQYTEDQWQRLVALLQSPLVVGVSELGFDFSVNSQWWPDQEALFLRLLGQGTQGRVLILHLRGDSKNNTAYAAHTLARRLLAKHCSPLQRIHIHNFSSDALQAGKWIAAFPYCYFGIAGMAAYFTTEQIQGLRAVPADRLILETDAPHLPPRPDMTVTSPESLGDVGAVVANLRGQPLATIMAQATYNAKLLYGLLG